MSILELFCAVDEFWVQFAPAWHEHLLSTGRSRRRPRATQLHPSEIMTILIWFHCSHYRTFKAYYTEYVQVHLRGEFPHVVSYQRFVELLPSVLAPLLVYLHTRCLGCGTGINFVDSTALAVCHNARIRQHRVFAASAQRGKTSVGWFYGFKLHLVVNDRGELLAFTLTPGNVDDRQPVPHLLAQVRRLFGKLIGDKGYISQVLTEQLLVTHGVQLVTKLRKNMRNILLDVSDKLLLRKRAIIETINDQLKNICQIEHSRHRSPTNFLVNLLGGLIAYCHQPKKPSLDLFPPALPAAQLSRTHVILRYRRRDRGPERSTDAGKRGEHLVGARRSVARPIRLSEAPAILRPRLWAAVWRALRRVRTLARRRAPIFREIECSHHARMLTSGVTRLAQSR